ncbi:hypothetical protein HanXRQr2_Chr15g0699411 [Helianthus annuus]|uniref:Uncharacterized protein n=1 Tax=Helianthus annuus TaxID=4232 RepID=A0A9K3H527_HELAN|nr:hypothetical protein HanXRQr2_Chr15g0699411 [Helianthus annuus]KAJ0831784.1 hypothetical protein HanPSC8_Chr15g0671101 [Helianthus annuus]
MLTMKMMCCDDVLMLAVTVARFDLGCLAPTPVLVSQHSRFGSKICFGFCFRSVRSSSEFRRR